MMIKMMTILLIEYEDNVDGWNENYEEEDRAYK